jgi:hypothetical protein
MSKYKKTAGDCNRICPYCGDSYQVEAEDYSEDMREEECNICGKKYHAYECFSVFHYANPDCELNGFKHQWVSRKVMNGYHDFCCICGACRPII